MNLQALIAECRKHGVSICLDEAGSIVLKGNSSAVHAAAERLRPHRKDILIYLKSTSALHMQCTSEAAQLQLAEKLMVNHSADGYTDDERRCNNIAFHLTVIKGWTLDEALVAAASWVVSNPEHTDEVMFVDIRNLLEEISGK